MSPRVVVNGDQRDLPDGATVSTALRALGAAESGRGMAVAIEGKVVPRSQWPVTELLDGARIELVTAVQGG